jgi:hypothetical protein
LCAKEAVDESREPCLGAAGRRPRGFTLVHTAPPPGWAADDPADQQRSVAELIEQLGSDRFEEREAATQQLFKHQDAAAALRQALKPPDAEVNKRAAAILKEFDQAELVALVKNGEVDLLIERLVHLPEGADEDAAWQAVLNLVSRLLDREKKDFGKTGFEVDDKAQFLESRHVDRVWKRSRPPILDLGKFERDSQPKRYAGAHVRVPENDRGCRLVRAEEVTLEDGRGSSLIVSSGPVRTKHDPGLGNGHLTSVIIAGGSVEVDIVHTSVIVCGGDLTIHHGLNGCLVLAQGKVKSEHLPHSMINCVVVSAGTVDLPEDEVGNCIIKAKEPQLLGLVKFFELAAVGVEVTSSKAGVQVKKVTESGPYGRAGLRADDRLLAIDEQKVDSPELFRRVLCRKHALGESLTLHVLRDGKPVAVVVATSIGSP